MVLDLCSWQSRMQGQLKTLQDVNARVGSIEEQNEETGADEFAGKDNISFSDVTKLLKQNQMDMTRKMLTQSDLNEIKAQLADIQGQ